MISTRAASQASMIPRLVCRSTIAPAGRAMSANAAVAAEVSRAYFEGAGLEQDHRGQRQRQLGDRRAHLADGLAAPQQHEVAVPPQAVLLPGLPRRRLGFRRRRGLVRFGGLFRGLLDGGAGRLWLLSWLQQWFFPGSGTAYTLVGGTPAMSIYIPSLSASWRALTWA